jgi:hypothetical protein
VTPRRWTAGHLIALVELACGVVAAAWLCGVAIAEAGTGGRSVPDRLFLLVLGAAVGVGLAATAVRRWRAAERRAEAPPQPEPASGAPPGPALSPAGERELARVVGLLAGAGVFAPRAPEPAQLAEAVADAGEPVLAEAVLIAVEEAGHHHPGFRPAEHTANLAFHDSRCSVTIRCGPPACDATKCAATANASVAVRVDVPLRKHRLHLARRRAHSPGGAAPRRFRGIRAHKSRWIAAASGPTGVEHGTRTPPFLIVVMTASQSRGGGRSPATRRGDQSDESHQALSLFQPGPIGRRPDRLEGAPALARRLERRSRHCCSNAVSTSSSTTREGSTRV